MGAISFENVFELICSCKRSRNCLIHTSRPIRLCNSFFDVGGCISLIARMYSGSGLKPLLFTICPRNFASDVRNEHLSGFKLSPKFQRAVKSCSRACMYSLNVFAWTKLSSMYAEMYHVTSSWPMLLLRNEKRSAQER